MKKVKIIEKHHHVKFWFANRVGEIFDLIRETEDYYFVKCDDFEDEVFLYKSVSMIINDDNELKNEKSIKKVW